MLEILGAVIAYLLGSIPTAVWVGKTFFHVDVREHGSGNSGATNTLRVLGKKPGFIVLLIDVLKGFCAVFLARYFGLSLMEHADFYALYQLGLAVCVVLGHIFPLFAQFKGGKGVATILGVLIALQPQAALIAFSIFVVVFVLTKYVSLGSILAAISYPFIVYFFVPYTSDVYVYFSFMVMLLIIFTHKKNIRRLIKGEESKISFRSK